LWLVLRDFIVSIQQAFERLRGFMRYARRILEILILILFFSGIMSQGLTSAITVKEEEDLSKEFLKVVMKQLKLVNDPIIVDYVSKVGEKILNVVPKQPFTYHFYVVDEDVYNAFAGPAGHVFINRGLLEVMESEEELAGILGHEISHVSCRHISQRIDRSKKIGMASLAGIAASILLGGGSEAILGTFAAGQAISLAYSRENEMQADQVGLKYLENAGYTGEGLLKVLNKIRSKQWFTSEQIPTYLTTHPAVEERLAYIGISLKQENKGRKKSRLGKYTEFEVVRSRLVALYGEEDGALEKFKKIVRDNPLDPKANYAYSLALVRTGDRKSAIKYMKKASENDDFAIYTRNDLGKIYFLDGQYEEAVIALKNTGSNIPYDVLGHFYLGRANTETGRYKEAVSILQDLLLKKPDYLQAMYYIGEAYWKQGLLGDAHFNLGKYYKEKKDIRTAVSHLKRALKNTTDPKKKQKIENMLKNMRSVR
jgi:beta-barrel assembly-enhancing protease